MSKPDDTQSGSDIIVTSKDTPTEVGADKIKDTQAEQSAKIAHTTQAELDEKIGNIIDDLVNIEISARFHNTDWAEYGIKQAVLDWHNKQTLELLDSLIAQQWSFGENDDALAVPTRYIEAERNKLKEPTNDKDS